MRKLPAAVWWACANIAAIIGFSRTSFGLLLPEIRHELAGSYYLYGWVTSANFVGYLAGNVILPFLLPRMKNRVAANAAAIALMALTMGLQGAAHDLVWLAVWRFFNGLAQAVTLVLTVTFALEAVCEDRRGAASGAVWMGAGLGIALVGALAGISAYDPALSWRVITLGLAVLSIAVVPGFSSSVRAGVHAAGPRVQSGAGNIQRLPYALATIAYGFSGAGFILFFTYFSAFARAAGVAPEALGFVWLAAGSVGAFGGMLWGNAYRRWGASAAALAMFAAAAGALCVISDAIALRAIGVILVCACMFGFAALSSALIRRYVTGSAFAPAFTVSTIVFAAGQMAAVPPAGALADRFGLPVTMLLTALAFAIAGLVTYANVRAVEPRPQRERRAA